MSRRRDKCKCGRIIVWEDGWDGEREVVCKHCGVKYTTESDDITVSWLEEKIERQQPYRTEAR